MTPKQTERYARHLVLREIGGPGQNALLDAKVCLVGAGGLGGPAALYLAAAGVGHIAIIDDDVVEASNLQRQVQFGIDHIGKPKARVLADRLMAINPDVTAGARARRLDAKNAKTLLHGFDVILDGTDRFATRFAVNKAAQALGTPLISGAVGRWSGQVGVFGTRTASGAMGPCYQCFVPDTPPQEERCAEVGIIGALTGIVGSKMALEAIKLITGAGNTLAGRLWIYDGLTAEGRTATLTRDPNCPICGKAAAL
jgi:molybdopterin/thiamine biosynthesis adenylyltransferase